MCKDTPSPVAVVGAGAVGAPLARRLAARDYPVRAVLDRTAATARALADQVGADVGTDEAVALPSDVRLVLICVPDDAIADVAETLATVNHPWARTVVGHTSGASRAEVLAPLAERGALPFSFHPLQTFTAETAPEVFEGMTVAVEGTPDAVAVGMELARGIGARPMELSAAEKARYHCAAALASNGFAALMGVVQELVSGMKFEEHTDGTSAPAAAVFAPLVEQTWANLKEAPAEQVLTGPVARGDQATVAMHMEALTDEMPHLVPLYAALSTEMTRLAVRGGTLTAGDADDILALLRAYMPSDDESPTTPSH